MFKGVCSIVPSMLVSLLYFVTLIPYGSERREKGGLQRIGKKEECRKWNKNCSMYRRERLRGEVGEKGRKQENERGRVEQKREALDKNLEKGF
jgi:hypothetical protein